MNSDPQEENRESQELFPQEFWDVPRKLADSSREHGATDDYGSGGPTLRFANRAREGGFAGIQTFAKLPVCLTAEALMDNHIDVAIGGVPWDGTNTGRSGARQGPWSIRKCDYKGGFGRAQFNLHTHVDAFEELKMCDFGDAPIHLGNTHGTLDQIRRWVSEILRADVIPVIMGGDHSVTWPSFTAAAQKYGQGQVGILHLTAHGRADEPEPLSHGAHTSAIRYLVDSGQVNAENIVQVGLRGYGVDPTTSPWFDENPIKRYYMPQIGRQGFNDVLTQAISEVQKNTPLVYLSVDIGAADPAFAPGTSTPEPGGFTSVHMMTAARRVAAETHLIGMDVVEVSPAYDDMGDVTALLANRIIREALTGIAMRKKGVTQTNYLHPYARGLDEQGNSRNNPYR